MKDQLDRIEARLESLIENRLTGLMPWGAPRNLVHELVASMHAHLTISKDGQYLAPNTYTIQVHPERLPYWQADPQLMDQMSRHLQQAATEAGIQFPSEPVMRLAANPELPTQGVQVIARIDTRPLGDTAALVTQVTAPKIPANIIPKNAFLIVNGLDTFPLRQLVVNIGRRLDNHLTIDDPRISRSHAQLRAIHGRYVLFDLNSTGGTYVNGQRISRIDLNPGDVISLAGVPLIFGQDGYQPETGTGQNADVPPGSTQSMPSTTHAKATPNRNK
ncbi:MAG: DUF3662 domain-containing protein [Anaerolineaceae bacterium]|nr:DUF3662 domain-containing protein [Anaerolineaceae bacterium]